MWNSLLDGMGSILAFFYAGIPSYGVCIIGLTILVRLLLFPLTAKQAISMRRMQQIQPEVKRLQAKYKDDRQKLNEEVMKFYKENNVNPLSGCLPLVAQMPIFFALFAVLRKPTTHIPEGSSLIKAFCGGASSCSQEAARHLRFLGMDLSDGAGSAHDGFTDALPYFVLVGLVALTGYFQFKQTQARQVTPNPQTAIIGKIFPVMFAFISLSMPSGTVLYFLVSNLWQVGQQAVIFKRLPPLQLAGGAVVEGTAGPARQQSDVTEGKQKELDPEPEPSEPPRRWGNRARAREAPVRPEPPARESGRAQPSGSRPRPKKRRR